MKIATITFNHAHNHGSMLQTYALQQFVKKIAEKNGVTIDYKVIDFYTKFQEDFYNVFKKGISMKSVVKNLLALYHYRVLSLRHKKFENFISESCVLTERYTTLQEIEQNKPQADIYISGSDQIWNVRAQDFSKAYYLPFAINSRRVSYAASFGPLNIDWQQYDHACITAMMREYYSISVREEGSADIVEKLTGFRPQVHLDPTFMLSADEWRIVQSDANYKAGKYILLYCLEPSKAQLKMAQAISKELNLPIVVLRYNNKNDWFNPFVQRYDAGPRDFLSYIDHAALVLSSSFHGTAFSLIYHKPFYVFNGMRDNRINTILSRTGLADRSIETIEDISRVSLAPVDENSIETFLISERKRSAEYLSKALGL